MKNKLSDLNDHLFAQMERLSDEDLTSDQLAKGVSRAGAIRDVAEQIIKNADLQLKAVTLIAHNDQVRPMLPMIGGKS